MQGDAESPHIAAARAGHDPRWYLAALPANMSAGVSAPLVPLLVLVGLGGQPQDVALAAMVTSLAGVPACALWGRLSDSTGRRRPYIVLGYAGFGLGMLLLGLAPHVPAALVGAAILGLLGTASAAAGPALIMETAAEKEWAGRIAEFSRVCSSGWLLGLVIGAAWLFLFHDTTGMRALCVVSAALGAIAGIGAWRWVREAPAGPRLRPDLEALLHLDVLAIEKYRFLPQKMIHHRFWREEAAALRRSPDRHPLALLLVALTILFTGFVMFYTVLPSYLSIVAGADASEVFVVYIASTAASTLFYPRAGRLVEKVGARRAVLMAAASRLPIFLSFPLVLLIAHDFQAVLVFAALNGLAGVCWTAISVGSTVAVTELAPASKAEAVGAFHAVSGIGAIAGAMVAVFLVGPMGFEWLIVLSAILIVAGIAFSIAARSKKPTERPRGSTRASTTMP